MFTTGSIVAIKGLKNRPDLNGKFANVVNCDDGKTQLALIEPPHNAFTMKNSNLSVARKCTLCTGLISEEDLAVVLCTSCLRVKRVRLDPQVEPPVLLAAAALFPEAPGPSTRPAASPSTASQPPAAPAASPSTASQPPAAPAAVTKIAPAQLQAAPAAVTNIAPAQLQAAPAARPVTPAPSPTVPAARPLTMIASAPVLEQAELEQRIVQMLDTLDFIRKGTDELEDLLRRVLRARESVSFKFLFQLSHCYQHIHLQNVEVLCERSLEGLLDQTVVGWNLQSVDRLAEMVEEQFPFFKKMLKMDQLYGFYNHGFIPEAPFRSKFDALYGQAADICHKHLLEGQNKDFTNHLYFLYSIALFDGETFTKFFTSDSRFPDELTLYCSMATIAGDYTKNIYFMFGRTISGGIKNKLAIFKAISEKVPHTMSDYDMAVVRLLESIEGPIERTLAVCTKMLDEELIDDKHFAFVVDKMFA